MKKKKFAALIPIIIALCIIPTGIVVWSMSSDFESNSEIYSDELTDKQIISLYKNDFGLQDIEQARIFSKLCDKPIEEILALKGKTTDYLANQIQGISNQNSVSRTWDEVAILLNLKDNESLIIAQNELNVKTKNAFIIKYGITPEEIKKYEAEGLNYRDIGYAKEIAQKYNTSEEELLIMRETGKDWRQIEAEIGDIKP